MLLTFLNVQSLPGVRDASYGRYFIERHELMSLRLVELIDTNFNVLQQLLYILLFIFVKSGAITESAA